MVACITHIQEFLESRSTHKRTLKSLLLCDCTNRRSGSRRAESGS
jgi:hypothetical protein